MRTIWTRLDGGHCHRLYRRAGLGAGAMVRRRRAHRQRQRGDEQRRYDDHVIHLEAGQRYRISVDSTAFDPVARLYRAGDTATPVAENDDGDGLNPRISYTPAESGDYILRVPAFGADGRGAYTAGLATLPPLPPSVPVPWSTSGRIETGDSAEAGTEGHRYDEYSLRLEAGRRYRLSVDASAFDPVARLYRAGADEVVAENDDGGDGAQFAASPTAPTESGDYMLRVGPLVADGRGAYRAAAELAPPCPRRHHFRRMEATIWRVYDGALTASDGDNDGTRFDDYLVHFDAGQERTDHARRRGLRHGRADLPRRRPRGRAARVERRQRRRAQFAAGVQGRGGGRLCHPRDGLAPSHGRTGSGSANSLRHCERAKESRLQETGCFVAALRDDALGHSAATGSAGGRAHSA